MREFQMPFSQSVINCANPLFPWTVTFIEVYYNNIFVSYTYMSFTHLLYYYITTCMFTTNLQYILYRSAGIYMRIILPYNSAKEHLITIPFFITLNFPDTLSTCMHSVYP